MTDRMTADELLTGYEIGRDGRARRREGAQEAQKRTQHDHCRAIRTTGADGSLMASKAEARRSAELEQMRLAGFIKWWRPQVSIPIGISENGKRTRYVVDFMVGWPDGAVTFEDVKRWVDSNKQKRDALREIGIDVRRVS